MYKPIDSRQSEYRGILQELFPWVSGNTLDVLLSSIDQDLTPPFKIDATSSPSLVVNIGPSLVANSVSGRNKSASFLGTVVPVFTGGTVTFPASSGGNIVTSTGGSIPLTLPSGDYVQILLAIDESNDIAVVIGTPNAVLADALVPAPQSQTQPFGYVTLHNMGGTIQNVVQSAITMFYGSGSGSGSGGGTAQEVPLTMGTTSQVVTFLSPQSSSSYVILGGIYNSTDPNPEFFPLTVTNKTTTTATFEWNQLIPDGNYYLDYAISPGLSEQSGESIVGSGQTSITITFPLALLSTNYVVIAELTNYTDISPQFQPVTITAKTISTFTVNWNVPTGSSNYRLAWQLAAYQ